MILIILSYFYIYSNINFIKILGITPFTILSILGVLLFFLKILIFKKNLKKKIIVIFSIVVLLPSLITIFYWITLFLNNLGEIPITPFNRYILRQLRYITASYFICSIYISVYKRDILKHFFNNLVTIICFENILALLRFFSVKINSILSKIQIIDEESILSQVSAQKIRLIGFSEPFFGAGILNSLALIILVFLILISVKNRNKLKYIIMYILILILGIFSSRTTIVGMGLSAIYYIEAKNDKKKSSFLILKSIFYIVLIGLFLFGLIIMLKNNVIKFQIIYEKFIVIYGKASLSQLLDMWKSVPQNLKTILIGDAKWDVYVNGIFLKYYKSTDIGYLRILWCIGSIGILLFLLNLVVLKNITKKYIGEKDQIQVLIKYIMYLILILNIKGYVDVLFINYFLLIYSILSLKNKSRYNLNFTEIF